MRLQLKDNLNADFYCLFEFVNSPAKTVCLFKSSNVRASR